MQNRGSVELAHTKKHGGAELAHNEFAEHCKTKFVPRLRQIFAKIFQNKKSSERFPNSFYCFFLCFLTWFSFVSLLKFFLGSFFSFVPKLRFLLLLNCEKHFSQLVFWAFAIFLSSFYCKKQLFTTYLLCFGCFLSFLCCESITFTPFLLYRRCFSFVSLVLFFFCNFNLQLFFCYATLQVFVTARAFSALLQGCSNPTVWQRARSCPRFLPRARLRQMRSPSLPQWEFASSSCGSLPLLRAK